MNHPLQTLLCKSKIRNLKEYLHNCSLSEVDCNVRGEWGGGGGGYFYAFFFFLFLSLSFFPLCTT